MIFDFLYQKDSTPFKIIDSSFHSDHVSYLLSIQNPTTKDDHRFSFRFSELQALHKQISEYKPSNLPKFPSKPLYNGKSLEDVCKRSRLIETYFNNLTAITDRKPQIILEQFLKEKVLGYKLSKKTSIIEQVLQNRPSALTFQRTASGSIFSGKEYVIEGEPPRTESEFQNYDDNIFDTSSKRKKLISKPETSPKRGWSFCSVFFGCYNH